MYAVLVSLMLCNDSESGTSPCLQSNQVEKAVTLVQLRQLVCLQAI